MLSLAFDAQFGSCFLFADRRIARCFSTLVQELKPQPNITSPQNTDVHALQQRARMYSCTLTPLSDGHSCTLAVLLAART